ncbi:MAG TPA: hypothetical protein VFU60_16900 [Ktedonobacterales bacterium]|nr:hypothetical protein [Ktedonobacterales bacterium]
MSGKVRCARCGKTFKPGRSSQTLCDQCEKQERAARAAARSSGASGVVRAPTASAAPVRIVGPAANLLDPAASSGVTTSAPPPDTGLYGSAAIREEQRRQQQRRDEQRRAEERARDEQRARERTQRFAEQHAHDARHDHHGQPRPAKPAPRGPQPAAAPRPPKPPRPATPQFVMTDELRATIEARYLELAQPVEFDGIRTRIAAELSVPKSHVKQAIAALRARMQLPSWWELQSYSGAETDLERIRMAYLPHLPVPAVGIHKTLAEDLHLDPRTVYQGIRRIRAEMRLPQYNAPEAHGDPPRDAQANAQAAADATPESEAQPVEATQAASAERPAEQESPTDEARM